ncbi:hypothetical protein [Methylobacterium gnaphalii]|uniref:Uncharacterized protein n=1 Tax=Methylobacterium gnaphalii TaxID=1010610 RepID=A0A512JMN0_9HYPH|nr:hypothetical protein [Methylobacterium gnaphalii]GEP11093.1 hypothetical protein MGN01_29380 [Methylobacterium gnaphalii]GJD67094.1 hypothetical protein MMMDOFMJ_0007 [Methylobacterium gnaphalii]GLS50371.1 hypothetical protein GCM10007885_32230 [Methylobacterium gnaphalii]
MIGRTYLERGKPVVVLIRWTGKGPRNVLIERASGDACRSTVQRAAKTAIRP